MATEPTVSGPEQIAAANPPSSLKVHLWNWLACVLPLWGAMVVPWWVMPERGTGSENAVGLVLWIVGVVGAALGSARFDVQREAHQAGARGWNILAWSLVVAVAVLGLGFFAIFGALGGGIGL